jgi:DDE superfamily endonuclease
MADKGLQGHIAAIPRKKPRGGELSTMDKQCNTEISALRAPIERLVAHFKSWRIFHTDYRRPHRTYHEAFNAARALFFFAITWSFE